jgi:phosphoribosylformylglycinamidine cyclo-ligase
MSVAHSAKAPSSTLVRAPILFFSLISFHFQLMATAPTQNSYAASGVDINEGTRAVELMKAAVKSTHGPQVLAGIGAFGGMFDASALKAMRSPVLVASTDGVGTKTKVAARLGRWDSVGQDLVNHCINDILVQGAKPLFFMDYVAAAKLDAVQVSTIVGGMATACKQIGCALLGGETAEMPGIYQDNEIDVAGTIVGAVDRDNVIDGARIQAGDVILALPSTGLHTNGYSLARRVLSELDWAQNYPQLGGTVGDALLAVHRPYLSEVTRLQAADISIHGLAHITGGGLPDNFPRILPDGLAGAFHKGSWPVNPIFEMIQELGHVPEEEMFHAFNMGIGLCVVLPKDQAQQAITLLGEGYLVGEITQTEGEAVIIA